MANPDRITAAFVALVGLVMLMLDAIAPGTHTTVEIIGACLLLGGTVGFLVRLQRK
jgi:hypothetical protein